MALPVVRPRFFSRLLVLTLIALIALGCDALTGGNKSSEDDAADDDSSSSKKKGKKKGKKKSGKKGKKKKKSGDDDDDDDDDDEKPAPAPPPPPPPPSEDATCTKVIRTLECMRDKLPPDSRSSMDESINNIKQAMKNLGPNAKVACESMLKGVTDAAKQHGCDNPDTSDRPSPLPGSPAPTPSPTPTTQSAPPSTSEWASVTKEVVVHGSSALNCETKMQREWLRVSCRGRNLSGGTPVSVSVTKGNGKWSDFVHNGPAVTSLVVRFVEGVDLEAKFTWTDRTHTLHVYWPSQSPEPAFKGKFQPLPK